MDTDILKPNTGYLSIERPANVSSNSTSKAASDRNTSSGVQTPDDDLLGEGSHGAYVEPASDGDEDEDLDLAPAKDEDVRTGLTGAEVKEAIAYRERMLKEARKEEIAQSMKKGIDPALVARISQRKKDNGEEDDEDEDEEEEEEEEDEGYEAEADERTAFLKQRKVGGAVSVGRVGGGGAIGVSSVGVNGKRRASLSINPLAPSSAFDETLKNRLKSEAERTNVGAVAEEEEDDEEEEEGQGQNGQGSSASNGNGNGDDRILVRDWRAPAGKKIAVPVRVEPKVYFASERTFLVRLDFQH